MCVGVGDVQVRAARAGKGTPPPSPPRALAPKVSGMSGMPKHPGARAPPCLPCLPCPALPACPACRPSLHAMNEPPAIGRLLPAPIAQEPRTAALQPMAVRWCHDADRALAKNKKSNASKPPLRRQTKAPVRVWVCVGVWVCEGSIGMNRNRASRRSAESTCRQQRPACRKQPQLTRFEFAAPDVWARCQCGEPL